MFENKNYKNHKPKFINLRTKTNNYSKRVQNNFKKCNEKIYLYRKLKIG